MTQDYEPIELNKNTPEPEEDGAFLINMDGALYEVVVHDSTFDPTHTWLHDGFWGKWSDISQHRKPGGHTTIQSLAAHDAQIRAEAIKEALSFSISEQKSFVKSMLKVLESYGCFDQIYDSWGDVYENAFVDDVNGQYGFDAVEAGIKAVNKLRESDTKEVQQ